MECGSFVVVCRVCDDVLLCSDGERESPRCCRISRVDAQSSAVITAAVVLSGMALELYVYRLTCSTQ